MISAGIAAAFTGTTLLPVRANCQALKTNKKIPEVSKKSKKKLPAAAQWLVNGVRAATGNTGALVLREAIAHHDSTTGSLETFLHEEPGLIGAVELCVVPGRHGRAPRGMVRNLLLKGGGRFNPKGPT